MTFRICGKCRGTNVKTLIPRLKQINPNAEIEIRCHNLCGIGRNKSFVIIDYIPIIGDNEDELIAKIELYLRKN